MKKSSSFGSIAINLIKFSLPLIFSGILQHLYSWTDAFIVGNVEGDLALGAIGATSIITFTTTNAITSFTFGLAVLFAQKYGSKDLKMIPRLMSTFLVFLGSMALVLSTVGYFLTGPLLKVLDTTEEVFEPARQYLSICFIGMPFLMIYNVYCSALRSVGDSRVSFYSVLISSIVNVILDLLFVAYFKWSVIGAAWATVLSQIAMTIFVVIYTVKKHELLRFKLGKDWFDKAAFVQGCKYGLPPVLQTGVSSAGDLLLQRFMNGFGTLTVTAITTAYRVDSIIMAPIFNLGSGISTLVAQEYGAGDRRQARKIFGVSVVVMIVVSLGLTLLVIPMGGKVIALFGAGEEVVKIGTEFFRCFAVFYVVFGLITTVRSYLEGIGDITFSSINGIISLGFRIFFSYTLVGFFGNMVIAYAEAFSWLISLGMYIVRMIWLERKESCKMNRELRSGE